jgi:predicted RNase H-like HicB family nuclease
LIYWRGKKFWLGKLLENPEIMTQGKTVQELIENIKDAYYQMILDEIPQCFRIKEVTV